MAVEPCRRKEEFYLGRRETARTKSALKDSKRKREGVGNLKTVGKKKVISNVGAGARPNRFKRL